MAYTWNYIKEAALAKLDLNEVEANQQHLVSRFYVYANEVITQVCSAIKPKKMFMHFSIDKDSVGVLKTMPEDFISFADDVCYEIIQLPSYQIQINPDAPTSIRKELHDDDFLYQGYNQVVFLHPGEFYIAYNARWFTFTTETSWNTVLDIPTDILDCIPSYIASQCFKIDDEYKASVFRNEYEMFLARIDATDYANSKTMIIGGNW